MGPDFVPQPPDNESSTAQGSAYPALQCHPDPFSPCLKNENPPTMGMNENSYTPHIVPEAFYDMMTSPYTSNQTLDMTSSYSTHQPLDNVNNGLTNLLPSTLFSYDQIDNGQKCDVIPCQSLDNYPADTVLFENELPQAIAGQPAMSNSTESMETVGSSSSGEIFNSEYTDTVSSTTSAAFLIRSSPDSDDDTSPKIHDLVTPDSGCCNDGYMSYSSTEVLNDESDDSGSQENLLTSLVAEEKEQEEADVDTEAQPMLLEIETNTRQFGDCSIEVGKSLTDFHPHPLSPIKENEIVNFGITEVEPKQYTKITDNIIVVDESFLFNSNNNLGDLESRERGKRATTMQNLHERSSFLDLTEISKVGKACQKALVYLKDDITMGSLVSLNTAVAKENNKDPMQSLSLISGGKSEGVLKKSSSFTKNLLAMSTTITLLYIAVGSVRNLQSSINHEGGVGVVGLAFNFVGYVMGSVFSSSIVQSFQPRRCLIANLFPNLLYIAANLYPVMWVMVPISFIQGISLAIVSNATSTYITHLAKGCSQKTKETFAEISCRFFGTYSLMYISHLIIGNLIASVILQPSSSSQVIGASNTTNSTLMENVTGVLINTSLASSPSSHLRKCGPNFCQHFEISGESQFAVSMETKYLLFGVYFGCIILAILIAVLFMEPLNTNLFRSTVSPLRKLKQQMSSLTKFFTDIKFILLLPLLMQSVMQFAFVTAEFAKGYITCALGMHMIGYTMICFGICSSISSFLCGLLNKYIGRIPFIVIASFKPSKKSMLQKMSMIPAFTCLCSVFCNG